MTGTGTGLAGKLPKLPQQSGVEFGVSAATICNISAGKSWRAKHG